VIHGLPGASRAPTVYSAFGDTLRALYRQDTPIIALCAAGIVIRTLAPLLDEKGSEPPVLAVAEDGSAVVPLLGGLGGVNVMARKSPRRWAWPPRSPPAASCVSAPACSTRQRAMPWRTWSKASASSPTCWPAKRCASKAMRPG
jgi:hypothetical protein